MDKSSLELLYLEDLSFNVLNVGSWQAINQTCGNTLRQSTWLLSQLLVSIVIKCVHLRMPLHRIFQDIIEQSGVKF